jgi:uncharacterized membrane protein YedE/YeeE
MKTLTKSHVLAFGSGLVFATGLVLSGMTQPEKVIGFLRVTKDWDPSLAFVMIGAIAVHALAYHLWLKHQKKPILAQTFNIPTNRKIDGRLLLGALLFGLGWGLGGYCPGPAVVSIMSLDESTTLFALSMSAGMVLFHFYERWRQKIHQALHAQNQQTGKI